MLSGRLRHRVTIQKKQTVPSPGGDIETWVDVQTRWARVALVSLEARAAYQQVANSNVRNQITFRGKLDIDLANHRFKWGSKVLKPVEPPGNPDGIGKYTTVVVAEVEASA